MGNQNELGGRRVHVWRGSSQTTVLHDPLKENVNLLADAIVAAVELYNRDETLVQLDLTGELIPVNLASLHALIDRHIAAVRIVNRGGVWQREYYSYNFAPRPNFRQPTMANPRPDAGILHEPDDKVLSELYSTELLRRIPKVQS